MTSERINAFWSNSQKYTFSYSEKLNIADYFIFDEDQIGQSANIGFFMSTIFFDKDEELYVVGNVSGLYGERNKFCMGVSVGYKIIDVNTIKLYYN